MPRSARDTRPCRAVRVVSMVRRTVSQALAGVGHAWRVRRSKRDELARRMQAWFDGTEPDERGPLVAALVILGLIAAPVMLCTVVVLGVALLRLLKGRRVGQWQRLLLAIVVGLHMVLQLARRAVLRRLHKTLNNVESRSGR